MYLVLSGEGPTDLGACDYTCPSICDRSKYQPGPMAFFIDELIHAEISERPVDLGKAVYMSRAERVKRSKAIRSISIPGNKSRKETTYYRKHAQALGMFALEIGSEKGEDIVGILFSDSDETCSSGLSEWRDKVESIKRGFDLAKFENGVPMVPKPKSEAWILCGIKDNPYQNCGILEENPGNKHSKDPLKERLKLSGEEVIELIKSGKIDVTRIDMPSFNQFKKDLMTVIDHIQKG